MTIDEAIKETTIHLAEGNVPHTKKLEAALMLCIKALERTSTRRERLSWEFEPLLPGETDD